MWPLTMGLLQIPSRLQQITVKMNRVCWYRASLLLLNLTVIQKGTMKNLLWNVTWQLCIKVHKRAWMQWLKGFRFHTKTTVVVCFGTLVTYSSILSLLEYFGCTHLKKKNENSWQKWIVFPVHSFINEIETF